MSHLEIDIVVTEGSIRAGALDRPLEAAHCPGRVVLFQLWLWWHRRYNIALKRRRADGTTSDEPMRKASDGRYNCAEETRRWGKSLRA